MVMALEMERRGRLGSGNQQGRGSGDGGRSEGDSVSGLSIWGEDGVGVMRGSLGYRCPGRVSGRRDRVPFWASCF